MLEPAALTSTRNTYIVYTWQIDFDIGSARR
jgi:hypothetical protein